MVKKPLAIQQIQEMLVRFLGLEAPLEEGRAATPVFSPGESHGQRGLVDPPGGYKESDTTEVT